MEQRSDPTGGLPKRSAVRKNSRMALFQAGHLNAERGSQSVTMLHVLATRHRSFGISSGTLGTGLGHDSKETPDPAQCVAECIDRDMFAVGKHVAQHILGQARGLAELTARLEPGANELLELISVIRVTCNALRDREALPRS